MGTAGRKPAQVDWSVVDNLLAAGCPGTEVASHLGIHPTTLYRHCEEEHKVNFTVYSQQKRAKGDALLRVAQFDEAVRERDRGLLIWLGKNRLGQSDKQEVEHKGKVPLQVVNYSDNPIEPWKDENKTQKEDIKTGETNEPKPGTN